MASTSKTSLLRRFARYTEFRTKVTSTLVFLLCLAFFVQQGLPLRWETFTLFFPSMLLFDLCTTAINNYIDSRSNGEVLDFSRVVAFRILLGLLVLASLLGFLLFLRSHFLILLCGGLCFLVGILYTAGPFPISRGPLGELFSGLFYGLMIPFLFFSLNLPLEDFVAFALPASWLESMPAFWQAQLLVSDSLRPTLSLQIHLPHFCSFLLISLPGFAMTALLMLSNNYCDVAVDLPEQRFTLPFYLGKRGSKGLYYALLGLPFVGFLLLQFWLKLPLWTACFYLLLPLLLHNAHRLLQSAVKREVFPLAVWNFLLVLGTQSLILFLTALIQRL